MTRRTKSEQPSKNGQKTADGKFAAGNKLGKGRPQGSRNKASLAVDALLEGEAEALTRTAIDKAKEGDTTALRLCLERLCPPRKDRPVAVELPDLAGAGDAFLASPSSAAEVATVLIPRKSVVFHRYSGGVWITCFASLPNALVCLA